MDFEPLCEERYGVPNPDVQIKINQWYREIDRERFYKIVSIDDFTLSAYIDLDGLRTINRLLFEIDLESGQLVECEAPLNEAPIAQIANEPETENSCPST